MYSTSLRDRSDGCRIQVILVLVLFHVPPSWKEDIRVPMRTQSLLKFWLNINCGQPSSLEAMLRWQTIIEVMKKYVLGNFFFYQAIDGVAIGCINGFGLAFLRRVY